jgi:hypothetical protein
MWKFPSRRCSEKLLAGVFLTLMACAADPYANKDPAAREKARHDDQMIKRMQSYVGWNIGTFMSDWELTPSQTTSVPDGNVYQFVKQQPSQAGVSPADLKCAWTIRTNNMGAIVQWSMRGNACPNADGP